jgi:hypothetical protein
MKFAFFDTLVDYWKFLSLRISTVCNMIHMLKNRTFTDIFTKVKNIYICKYLFFPFESHQFLKTECPQTSIVTSSTTSITSTTPSSIALSCSSPSPGGPRRAGGRGASVLGRAGSSVGRRRGRRHVRLLCENKKQE